MHKTELLLNPLELTYLISTEAVMLALDPDDQPQIQELPLLYDAQQRKIN